MYIPEKRLKLIKKLYPVGSKVELISMDDPQAPPKGTKGEVYTIDSIGQIHVNWENGSSLALIYGIDDFKRIE